MPLDVDVTLPATGSGPVPDDRDDARLGRQQDGLRVHQRRPATATRPSTTTTSTTRSTASRSSTTPRAAGATPAANAESRTEPGCKEGWIRLADQRYEARDTQYLLGLLADEGIAKPKSIGVTGISYGGGQTIELAYLKNRIRLPNGEFVPWKSPGGKAMEIKAAFPRWPWSDLVDALEPNGRFLDSADRRAGRRAANRSASRSRAMSPVCSPSVRPSGYVAPPGADPEADLTKWFAADQRRRAADAGRRRNRQPDLRLPRRLRHPLAGKPAPLLIESGWTDDLFPPEQSLRVYNQVRAAKGYAALMFGDLGHSRGGKQGKHRPRLQRRGRVLLRLAAGAQRHGAEERLGQRLHADLPRGGPG